MQRRGGPSSYGGGGYHHGTGGRGGRYQGGPGSGGGGQYRGGAGHGNIRGPAGQHRTPLGQGDYGRRPQSREEQQELPQRLTTQHPSLPTQMQAFQSATRHLDTV